MKLTERQIRFADEFIRTGEITRAAMIAGYSPKSARQTGQENMSKPNIKAYIDERLLKLRKESIAEQDEVLQYLTSVLRGNATGTALVGVGGGEESVEQLPPTTAEKTKAAELLARRFTLSDRDRLQNELIKVQIRKAEKELEVDTSTEDKLKDYFDALGSAFIDDET